MEPVRFTRFDVRVKRITLKQIMKRLCIFFAVVIMQTGCATQPQSRHLTSNQPMPDGTVVDYAGVPCGNQNMHVKSPLCLFPRTLLVSPGAHMGS